MLIGQVYCFSLRECNWLNLKSIYDEIHDERGAEGLALRAPFRSSNSSTKTHSARSFTAAWPRAACAHPQNNVRELCLSDRQKSQQFWFIFSVFFSLFHRLLEHMPERISGYFNTSWSCGFSVTSILQLLNGYMCVDWLCSLSEG